MMRSIVRVESDASFQNYCWDFFCIFLDDFWLIWPFFENEHYIISSAALTDSFKQKVNTLAIRGIEKWELSQRPKKAFQ